MRGRATGHAIDETHGATPRRDGEMGSESRKGRVSRCIKTAREVAHLTSKVPNPEKDTASRENETRAGVGVATLCRAAYRRGIGIAHCRKRHVL